MLAYAVLACVVFDEIAAYRLCGAICDWNLLQYNGKLVVLTQFTPTTISPLFACIVVAYCCVCQLFGFSLCQKLHSHHLIVPVRRMAVFHCTSFHVQSGFFVGAILLSPAKFAVPYTLGSICSILRYQCLWLCGRCVCVRLHGTYTIHNHTP